MNRLCLEGSDLMEAGGAEKELAESDVANGGALDHLYSGSLFAPSSTRKPVHIYKLSFIVFIFTF